MNLFESRWGHILPWMSEQAIDSHYCFIWCDLSESNIVYRSFPFLHVFQSREKECCEICILSFAVSFLRFDILLYLHYSIGSSCVAKKVCIWSLYRRLVACHVHAMSISSHVPKDCSLGQLKSAERTHSTTTTSISQVHPAWYRIFSRWLYTKNLAQTRPSVARSLCLSSLSNCCVIIRAGHLQDYIFSMLHQFRRWERTLPRSSMSFMLRILEVVFKLKSQTNLKHRPT